MSATINHSAMTHTTKPEHHELSCYFTSDTGSIERLIRVIRVRGFRVEEMQLELTQTGYEARFRVAGSRSVSNLISQLQKLVEVQAVILAEPRVTRLSEAEPMEQCA